MPAFVLRRAGALVFAGLQLATAVPLYPQALSGFERGRALTMLSVVQDDIRKHYFDPAIGGVDLAAIFDTAKARIAHASRVEETLLAIAQATIEVNDHHTLFISPELAIRADYGWTMGFVGDTCRALSVAPGSDAGRQGVQPGDALLQIERFQPTRSNLVYIRYMISALFPRKNLRVVLEPPRGAPREMLLEAELHERRRTYDLTAGHDDIWDLLRDEENQADSLASRYREFGDTVLLWRLKQFLADKGTADDGLRKVRGHRALILDLRGNPGGAETTLLRLLNGFYPDSMNVATIRSRDQNRAIFITGSRERAYRGTLVVLVDSRSASASEAFARTIQLSGRGRVLGDRTAGALRRARGYVHEVGTQTVVLYGTSVTTDDVILPDGKSIENVGLTPDEVILPTGSDMAAGADPVLAHALSLAGVDRTPAQAGRLIWHK